MEWVKCIQQSSSITGPLSLVPTHPILPPTTLLYMAAHDSTVEMFFFPFVGGGHLIPMIDLARVFASYGVKSTIITFPNDVVVFQKSISRDTQYGGHDISLITLQPPPGADSSSLISVDMSAHPFIDTSILRQPLQKLLQNARPDCIVVDAFHRWSVDIIDEIGLTRFTFNGSSCFAKCCTETIERYSPQTKAGSDSEPFSLPGLPDKVEITASMLPELIPTGKGVSPKPDDNSYGHIVNSFYELEPAYVDHLRNVLGKKAWIVGPVSLFNMDVEDKINRGQLSAIDEHICLNWLDSKPPESVIYISFGSLARLNKTQLHEIALGLESSGHYFIWVIGKILDEIDGESILPEGFEERIETEKKGLIIKGWAPQLLILEHEAVGGFVTHCGWNSTLEGVCAGVPMITWPLTAEQFHNENLLTEVLKIGIRVGSQEWGSWNSVRKVVIGRKKVEEIVARLMGGEDEEVREMKTRVRNLGEKARKAVSVGGSSFSDAYALIDELKQCKLRPKH